MIYWLKIFFFQIYLGEVRAWHGACYVNHEIFIHSGSTQEFYSNRLELDDHAESVLTFEFGVKSLLLLCVESIENAYDSNSTNPILEEILPLNLRSMLVSRSLFNEGTMLYNLKKCNFEKFAMFQKLTSILFFIFQQKWTFSCFFLHCFS